MSNLQSAGQRSIHHSYARVVVALFLGATFGCSSGVADTGPDEALSQVPEAAENVGSVEQAVTLACQSGPENTNAACSDGISNDGDSYIDCNDFDCCGSGLSVCSCCGNGCGPVYQDSCSCSIACTTNAQCAAGQYCYAAGDCAAACRPIPTPPPARPVKIAEYNVLGVDPKDPNPAWVATLVAQDADVAVLVETDWDDIQSGTTTWCTYYFNQINAALSAAGKGPYTDYHCARGISFYTEGTTILSRFPILSATHVGEGHPVAGYHDDANSVTACDNATTDPFMDWVVQAPGGTQFHAISAHLKCCNTVGDEPSRRAKSQECINNYIDSLGSSAPVLYTGDLNSFSPTDGDPSCFGQSGLGTDALSILYSSTDSRRTLNHTWTDGFRHAVPLVCGNSATYGITYPSLTSRIDFLEFNQQLSGLLGAAAVGTGGGSDHQPTTVLLNFGGASCSTDAQCNDGLFCNGAEHCVTGSCQPGTNPCMAGQSCNESTDTCFTPSNPFINEFHYDNAGTDSGEFVEVAGQAGLNLSGYSIVAYNGSGGSSYKTVNLSGVIPTQQGCMGTLSFAYSGLQNGAPDGIALVGNGFVQFLSYEGAFRATNGPANGIMSVDIGRSETTSTPVGYSLRLTGTGSQYSQFAWQAPATASAGSVNQGQAFAGCP